VVHIQYTEMLMAVTKTATPNLSLIALLRSLEHGELTSLSQIEHSHKLGYSWGTSIRALEIAGAKRNKARILEAVLTCLVKELNPD